MNSLVFIKGFIIGLCIAAPVGPIGILCINRTLSMGLFAGLASGLGAALADAVYGCIAGFGLVSISAFLLAQQKLITLVGGAFLIYLGIRTFFQKKTTQLLADKATSYWKDFTTCFLLTMTNPATIISFIAIYASLGIIEPGAHYLEAMLIVAGVFSGSLLWWCILCYAIHYLGHKLSDNQLKWINRASGIMLCCFGLLAALTLLHYQ